MCGRLELIFYSLGKIIAKYLFNTLIIPFCQTDFVISLKLSILLSRGAVVYESLDH